MGILLTPPSIHLSLRLFITLSPPKPLGEILPSLPLMVRVCKSSIIFLCVHRRSSCLSCYFLLTTGRNSSNLATLLPHMVGIRESNIIFPYVCLGVHRPSICLSRYLLLNHWAEYNQMLHHFPSWWGCAKQHFFHASVVRPFVCHAISS